MADKRTITRTISLFYTRLWYEWAYSFGACLATVVLSCYCSSLVMPAIVLIMSWGLNILAENDKTKHGSHCLLIVKQTSGALLLSVVVMTLCILINRLFVKIFDRNTLNVDLPYITAIIVFTILSVKLFVFIILHDYNRHCRDCKVRHGLSPHDAFVGNMLHNESKFLLKLAIVISTIISIVAWVYYLGFYNNHTITIKDINILVGLPIALYIISLLYLASIYAYTVHIMRSANIELCNNNITTLRYLVLRGDKLLTAKIPNKLVTKYSNVDTPASVNIEFHEEVSDEMATERFEAISGIKDFKLRRLYNNSSFAESANVFHFAILMDDSEALPTEWTLGNDWLTLDQINRAWRYNDLSPALSAEIHRIFATVMAWKTYDRNGMRLYPIKNYHPTFRLRDFKNWDVDYNDMTWMRISEDNQDKAMFKARKFIRKITTLHVK